MLDRARVTIVQFGHDASDPRENLDEMRRLVHQHAASDLVVFPELALHGHEVTEADPRGLHQALRGVEESEIEDFHRDVARAGTAVVYGALVRRAERIRNVAIYTDGAVRHEYAKTHVHWTEPFDPGTMLQPVDTVLGSTGLLICFDAAFAEVGRVLALAGARVLVNVSAIPDHFPLDVVHRRVQASSVFNQAITIFANRRGPGYAGGSAVADATGVLVHVAGADQEHLTVDLDLTAVDRWRQEEPLLVHRRPDLYGTLAQAAVPDSNPNISGDENSPVSGIAK